MIDPWQHDLEALEAVAQDETARVLCLRMAAMTKAGTLAPFLARLDTDADLDALTRETIAEIASDEHFLLAVEDYVRSTARVH